MALTEKDTELVEQYLLGKLTREEAKQVEKRMKYDSEFAEEIYFMRDVILAVQEKGREELSEIMKDNGHKPDYSLLRKIKKILKKYRFF